MTAATARSAGTARIPSGVETAASTPDVPLSEEIARRDDGDGRLNPAKLELIGRERVRAIRERSPEGGVR